MRYRLNNRGATIMIHAHQTAPTQFVEANGHPLRPSTAATTRTMIMPALTGKTALVTGASRGMGRASALALAAAGAQVLVHYGRGAKEADGVVAEIRKAGSRVDAIATDLTAADGADKLARQTRSIVGDRLDILVANAAVSKAGRAFLAEFFDRQIERGLLRMPNSRAGAEYFLEM